MPPVIAGARGAFLVDSAGREYLDFSMGYGSVWLGHGHPAIAGAIESQLRRYAAPGFLASGAFEAAEAAFARLLPPGHFLAGIYSTGMEAVEAAIRTAWAHTGRQAVAGLAGSEHGRSFLTGALGGKGLAASPPDCVHVLPGPEAPEALLEKADELSRGAQLAALVVEPIQMTAGARTLEPRTAKALFDLARARGFAVVFDEALTAPYRCGAALYCDLVGEAPDVLVLGKGLGNGFPCAALALRRGFGGDRAKVRPGSTFWNHPLACAAVAATLEAIHGLDPMQKVLQIERVVEQALQGLPLRGRGAMWCVALPDASRQAQFVERLLEAGVVVSYYPGYIRLLPPLTIEAAVLRRGCEAIRDVHAHTFG